MTYDTGLDLLTKENNMIKYSLRWRFRLWIHAWINLSVQIIKIVTLTYVAPRWALIYISWVAKHNFDYEAKKHKASIQLTLGE